jgi:hypothetical protein
MELRVNHRPVISCLKSGDSKPWTSGELELLRRLAPLGAVRAAQELGRTVWSVRSAAKRHGISLRRQGERRGLILGQPRGVSSSADPRIARLRAAVLSGEVDPARVVEVGRASLLPDTPVCPACGVRPVTVSLTGFCRPCHLRALAAGHAHELEVRQAARELDRERQRKHRSKR